MVGHLYRRHKPAGESFLRKRFKEFTIGDICYYKIDGLHTGAPSENIYVNRSYDGMPVYGDARLYNDEYTFTQCFRKGLSILKEESPGVFLLGCAATQNMSSLGAAFGMVNAMRVGPDNDGAIRGVWKSTTAGADYAVTYTSCTTKSGTTILTPILSAVPIR